MAPCPSLLHCRSIFGDPVVMTSYSGKFRYLEAAGTSLQEGSCRLTFEEETLTLTPSGGAGLACDLADIDSFSPGEYELSLKLYTGKTILLYHFAKDFQNLCRCFLEAWRERVLKCLLLEDLEEVARFDGSAQLDEAGGSFSGRAEIRLYRSNLAILPENAGASSWRLADIDSVDFDEATYTLGLRSGADRLILTRLAKRTREFIDKLREGMTSISEKGASRIHGLFPFLTPDQTRRVAELMREGRAVHVSKLTSIHSKIPEALLRNAVDAKLKPYFDRLVAMAGGSGYFTGYKFIRPGPEDEEFEAPGDEVAADSAEADAADGGPSDAAFQEQEEEAAEEKEETNPALHFFYFPLSASRSGAPAGVVAWEAGTRGGRATYFFRLESSGSIEDAVGALNRAIVLLNFRREPIYLPDDSLETQPRFHRYAIASRKIPALRRLRSAFLGRAIHTTPEAWAKQVQNVISRA